MLSRLPQVSGRIARVTRDVRKDFTTTLCEMKGRRVRIVEVQSPSEQTRSKEVMPFREDGFFQLGIAMRREKSRDVGYVCGLDEFSPFRGGV